jgi:hypothetical protein
MLIQARLSHAPAADVWPAGQGLARLIGESTMPPG